LFLFFLSEYVTRIIILFVSRRFSASFAKRVVIFSRILRALQFSDKSYG